MSRPVSSVSARAIADLSQGVILASVEIAAPPERVFRALTESGDIVHWWEGTTEWSADLRVGGRWRAAGGADGSGFTVEGEFLEIVPPRKLVQTWTPSWDAGVTTTLTYTLDAVPGGTRVTLRHEGFVGRPESCQGHAEGWERVLGWLAKFHAAKGPADGALRLHVMPASPRAIKAMALNRFLGLDCEIRVVDFFKEEQTSAEFAALNPNRRQPVLEHNEFVLWESNAILFYLASLRPERGLWPALARDQADVMRWLSWEANHWDLACDILITERLKRRALVTQESGRRTRGPTATPGTPDPARVAEGEEYLRELGGILDAHLANRTWLVGEKLSIADFALGAWLPAAQPAGFPLDGFREIARWYERVQALPGWA